MDFLCCCRTNSRTNWNPSQIWLTRDYYKYASCAHIICEVDIPILPQLHRHHRPPWASMWLAPLILSLSVRESPAWLLLKRWKSMIFHAQCLNETQTYPRAVEDGVWLSIGLWTASSPYYQSTSSTGSPRYMSILKPAGRARVGIFPSLIWAAGRQDGSFPCANESGCRGNACEHFSWKNWMYRSEWRSWLDIFPLSKSSHRSWEFDLPVVQNPLVHLHHIV